MGKSKVSIIVAVVLAAIISAQAWKLVRTHFWEVRPAQKVVTTPEGTVTTFEHLHSPNKVSEEAWDKNNDGQVDEWVVSIRRGQQY